METSSADTGSSQMMNSGSSTSARAMQMRWHCPPENSCGNRPITSAGSRPTAFSTLATRLVPLAGVPDAGDDQRLGNDVADAPTRIERGDRVLEDQLHAAAHLAQSLAPHRGQILAVEQHLARYRRPQLQHRTAERGLAATGFADKAQRLAARDLEADIGDCVHDLVAGDVFDDEIFHFQQRRCQGLLHHAPAPAASLIGWKQAY